MGVKEKRKLLNSFLEWLDNQNVFLSQSVETEDGACFYRWLDGASQEEMIGSFLEEKPQKQEFLPQQDKWQAFLDKIKSNGDI